jgi:hypothetical protein
MRIVRLTFNAPGNSDPIPVDYMQPTFNVALGMFPAAGTTVAAKAQFCMDDQSIKRQVTWTQSGTTVTITDGIQPYGKGASSKPTQQNPHGLITGDTINFEGSLSGGPVSFDGNYPVTVVDPTHYTIAVTPSQTVAAGVADVIPQRWLDTTILPAASATRIMSNTTQPATAYRFVIATLTGGSVDFLVLQGSEG